MPCDGPTALIVHLDLNKTVVMSDPAAGADTRALLSSVLASAAWGVASGGSWALARAALRARPPPPAPAGAPLISYMSFVKSAHPFVRAARGASPAARAAAAARNSCAKKRQQALLAAFACGAGAPGAAFAPLLESLLARLAVPPPCAAACAASGLRGLRDGARFLLPSYFRLLRWLRTEQRLPFLVVLRTFGSDLEAAVAEHNAWAAGEHPIESGGDAALSIASGALAAVTRAGADAGELRLHAAAGGGDASSGAAPVAVGVRAIYDLLMATLPIATPPAAAAAGEDAGGAGRTRAPGRVAGWRDDWSSWFAHDERAYAGKLLPLEPADDCLQVFLDDNVGDERHTLSLLGAALVDGLAVEVDDGGGDSCGDGSGGSDSDDGGGSDGTDAGIVDARSVDGTPLRFSRVRNVHLARVCPLSAIVDPDYFVNVIQRMERRWRARRSGSDAT
jgi:hypothetical protein